MQVIVIHIQCKLAITAANEPLVHHLATSILLPFANVVCKIMQELPLWFVPHCHVIDGSPSCHFSFPPCLPSSPPSSCNGLDCYLFTIVYASKII